MNSKHQWGNNCFGIGPAVLLIAKSEGCDDLMFYVLLLLPGFDLSLKVEKCCPTFRYY
jgi:hypothetical protein